MYASTWRFCVVLLALAGFGLAIAGIVAPVSFPSLGYTTGNGGNPSTGIVRSVRPDSPASRAGVRRGDRILTSAADRWVCYLPQPGRPCPMTLLRGGIARRVTLTADGSHNSTFGDIVVLVMRLSFLFMAALLAWRRSDDKAARALASFFLCFGVAAGGDYLRVSGALSQAIAAFITQTLFMLCFASAVFFAALFPRKDAAGPRAVLLAVTPIIVLCAIATNAAQFAQPLLDGASSSLFTLIAGLFWLFYSVSTVVALTISFVRSQGLDRERMRWMVLTFAAGFSGLLYFFVTLMAGVQTSTGDLTAVTVVLIPIGMGYVMLRHRLLDIGFVINTAVVFAVVSAIVVAIFVALETLLSTYVESTNHLSSVAVQIVVALGVGFSIRPIHAKVDRLVDNVFFGARHRAEAAILAFAKDCALITDATVLLQRCVETALRYGKAQGTGVWLRSGNGEFAMADGNFETAPQASENDPGILAMRSRHVAVDLVDARSALPGEMAFPMIVRGRLLGALVCGPKAGTQTYAPDERSALALMVAAVGNAYDALTVRDLKREVARALSGAASFEAARPMLERLAGDDGFAVV